DPVGARTSSRPCRSVHWRGFLKPWRGTRISVSRGRLGLPLARKRQRYLMALILAVDPDQRQHAALAYLARELDGHELLSAASCADALAALDRRPPDLVLLPVLLPPAEEGELLSRL